MEKMSRSSNKESTSCLFSRYVWLVDTIYRNRGITFKEINEQWLRSANNNSKEDLPLKTFHNHRRAIEELFEINIECDRKNGCIYYIQNPDDMKHERVRSWLLNTFAVNNLINESYKIKNRILLEEIPSGQHFLARIIEAMQEGRTIEITYQSFWKEESRTFKAEPYCVKIFKQRWYLVAKSDAHEEARIYALDRIQSLTINSTKFTLPGNFDAETYFYHCFGIFVDENCKIEKVKIKVFDYQVRYLRALPLHHSQLEKEECDDYSVFEYFLRPTFDFYQELLSHGAEIEVLSPLWLRDEMRTIVRAMAELYH